ncbi:MAG: HIT family protein [Clostridia bacterium]|jgi:histidine triad (HIT) family protein|nr:HIT family protein [Clostridia bacterium]
MLNNECLFCKIIKGEIPAFKVYEDEYTLAFLDKFPSGEAHALVIPKVHAEKIFDMTEDMSGKVFKTVNRVAKMMKDNLGIEDLNVLQNNGSVSGQIVNHVHVHLIPRKLNDNIEIDWESNEMEDEKLEKILERFKG